MTDTTPTIADIRRRNLTRLLTERFNGRQSNLARAVERKPDYIWRIFKEQKGFGEVLARDIEAKLLLPEKWLDDPDNSTSTGAIPEPRSKILVVPYFSHSPEERVPGGVPIRESWIDRCESKLGRLFALPILDQSMSASLPQGDELVFDTGETTPLDGGLFFIRHGNAVKARRLSQESRERWLIRCDTFDKMRFPDVSIPESELDIIGRILWAGGKR